MSLDEIKSILELELKTISTPEIKTAIESLLVIPQKHLREFDYSPTHEHFECWTILEHPDSGTGIAYSQHGFGPKCPWGLVWLEPGPKNYGMDCGWFTTLEEAFCGSCAASGLRIWNVVEFTEAGDLNVIASRLNDREASAMMPPMPSKKMFARSLVTWPRRKIMMDKDLQSELDPEGMERRKEERRQTFAMLKSALGG